MIDEIHIGIVSGRFNLNLCERLVQGARLFFSRQEKLITIKTFEAPGAYELPLGAQWLIENAERRNEPLDGLVALGVVIRGETPHFDYVAGRAANGIMQVSLRHSVPIGFGLVTANNYKQAAMRSSLKVLEEEKGTKKEEKTKESNKGYEAAQALWEMIKEKHRLQPV